MTFWTRKKPFIIATLLSLGLLMGCNVSANNTQASAQEKKVKSDLESKVKQLEIKSVKKMSSEEYIPKDFIIRANNERTF